MTTPILGLDEWTESQGSPHITVNENVRWLELFAQLIVIDRTLTAPPSTPADGDVYIPAATATGAWAGHEDDVAAYIGNEWQFKTPRVGWRAVILNETIEYIEYQGSSGWAP